MCLIAFDLKFIAPLRDRARTVLIPHTHPSPSLITDASILSSRTTRSRKTRTASKGRAEKVMRVRATSEHFRASAYSERDLLAISRKEVIQPQVPLRLPCYDFAPVTELTFGGCLLAVSPPTSGPPSFHGVTGGVYKARERIHRGVADPRLLAIPASCSRVADYNPNLDRLLAIGSPSRVGDALYRPL